MSTMTTDTETTQEKGGVRAGQSGSRLAVVVSVLALAVTSTFLFCDKLLESPHRVLDRRIHDYLLNNPDTLIEALKRADGRLARQRNAQVSAAIAERHTALFADPLAPVIGLPDARVTIVEFFDYRCGYCKQMKPMLDAVLHSDNDVRIVLKELPILGQESVFAARAVLAAGRQGKHDALHDAMLAFNGQLNEQAVLQIATRLGIEVERLRADANAPDVQNAIESNMELARDLDIRGTPTFVIGSDIISGSLELDDLKQRITKLRR